MSRTFLMNLAATERRIIIDAQMAQTYRQR
jgi:hypothetical protein